MSRKSSPYVIGDHWLDQRTDGRSKGIWQVTSYNPATRSTNYRSTHERDLERAKSAMREYLFSLEKNRPARQVPLDTFLASLEAFGIGMLGAYPNLGRAPDRDAALSLPAIRRHSVHLQGTPGGELAIPVIPQIFRYWEDHGETCASANNIAACLRAFLGFLTQDELGSRCTFHDLDRRAVERFRDWSMKPHQFEVEWYGKRFRSVSGGLGASSFNKRLAALKAALNHAVEEGVVPGLRRMPKPLRVERGRRTRVLSVEELGAIVGYARSDQPLLNWILLMLGTGCRPGIAMKLVPSEQFDTTLSPLLDLHPKGTARTKKRNPIVPVIPQLGALLRNHVGHWTSDYRPHQLLDRWRLLRQDLGFDREVVSNTIRHTVASELEWRGASATHISELLGHLDRDSLTEQRKAHRPTYMGSVIAPLSEIWSEVQTEADRWCERYAVIHTWRGRKRIIRQEKLSLVHGNISLLHYGDWIAPPVLAQERSNSNAHTSDIDQKMTIRRKIRLSNFFKQSKISNCLRE